MTNKVRKAQKYKSLRKLNSAFGNILTSEEFKVLINYERIRSDRNGSIFSIVIFDSTDKNKNSLKYFVTKLTQMARSIDCIGWFGKEQIAILLPDTKKHGAVVFGNKLIKELSINRDEISFDIYSYPENWLDNEISTLSKDSILNPKSNSNKNDIESFFINKMPKWKRILDISGSVFIMIMVSPICLLLSLYIKTISPGPIFFKQTRIGYKGIPFTFWKFRTMKFDNNQSFHGKHSQSFITNGDVPMEKLDGRDPRIFLGGKVIRKSCLDELPQLWNILKGDMSLVGPRPCIPYEADEYLRWHTHRFDTVPGLSGLWQVSGKNKLTFKQMIRLDINYCNNMSLFGDIIIILRTPVAIMKMVAEAAMSKVKKEIAETNIIIDQTPTPKRKAL